MKKLTHIFSNLQEFEQFLNVQMESINTKDLIVDIVNADAVDVSVDEVKEKILQCSLDAKVMQSREPQLKNQMMIIFYCNSGLVQKIKKQCQESKLVQMKEMINMIAHHWRQPLNTISSLAMSLELSSKFGSLNDEEVQKHCHTIQKNANNLSQVITIFSHFEQAQRSDEQFFLQPMFDEILELFQTHFQTFHIDYSVEIDPLIKIKGDSKLFKQVIFNIISNSIDAFEQIDTNDKFIKVDMSAASEKLILKIQDNAGGVGKDFQNMIFNPYFTTKTDCECTGLGLSISKEIMKSQFDGDLDFYALDDGSAFLIEIPNKNNFRQRQ